MFDFVSFHLYRLSIIWYWISWPWPLTLLVRKVPSMVEYLIHTQYSVGVEVQKHIMYSPFVSKVSHCGHTDLTRVFVCFLWRWFKMSSQAPLWWDASSLLHSPFLLACERDLGELGEVLGVFLFYLYPEGEVETSMRRYYTLRHLRFLCWAKQRCTERGSGALSWQLFGVHGALRRRRWRIPFSYELCHLFLHLLPLQLLLEQHLKPCDAAVALGILPVHLRGEHSVKQTLSSTPEHSTRLLHAGRKAALKHNKASPSPSDINSIRYICCWKPLTVHI